MSKRSNEYQLYHHANYKYDAAIKCYAYYYNVIIWANQLLEIDCMIYNNNQGWN